MASSFYQYFKENMDSMGLPVPETLFGTLSTATSTINSIVAVVTKFGTRVTVGELVGAGALSEGLIVVGGVTAAFYVGACIGSLAVATGRSLSGGYELWQLFTASNSTPAPWLRDYLMRTPALRGNSGATALA
jgi:hypothetical protein